MLRLVLIIGVWLLATGTTVVKCSSGSDFRFDDENRPPLAADGFYQTSSSSSVTGRMAATDPDDDELTYSVVSGPVLGSLRNFDSRTGFFTYVPAQVGSDNFSFRASDGRLSSNTAIVNILITLQTADAGTDEEQPTLAAVHPDPLDPGALLLLWAPPADRVEKLSADGAGRELLASEVESVSIDHAVPGRLLARGTDGKQRVSVDGGRRWYPADNARWAEDSGRDDLPRAAESESAQPLARARDPFAQQVHILVVSSNDHSEVWRSVGDGSVRSLLSDHLPGPADAAGLLADPRVPDRWMLRLGQGASTRILLSTNGGITWDQLALLQERDARLIDCASRVCLLSDDGHRLWRLDGTAPRGVTE